MARLSRRVLIKRERYKTYKSIIKCKTDIRNGGCYMSACGYKFYLQVFNSIYHKWAQWTSEISSWILEDKICIRKRACNILFIIQTPMARCCDALLLLAETEVAMTTMISSHVKDKNCIFTRYQIFVTGKILVFRRCLYNKYICDPIWENRA